MERDSVLYGSAYCYPFNSYYRNKLNMYVSQYNIKNMILKLSISIRLKSFRNHFREGVCFSTKQLTVSRD